MTDLTDESKTRVLMWLEVPGAVEEQISDLTWEREGGDAVTTADGLVKHLREIYDDAYHFASDADLFHGDLTVHFQVDHVDEAGKSHRTVAEWKDGRS